MLKSRKLWDLREFNKINLPEIIDTISEKRIFSHQNSIRILDMPLHMPGQGWHIHKEVMQFLEILDKAFLAECQYDGHIDNLYCYITVDQKQVLDGKTQRRPGAHADAYIEAYGVQVDVIPENIESLRQQHGEVSHTYICYDVLPTEFFLDKFPLYSPKCEDTLSAFDVIAANAPIYTYPAYTILRLDPYVVHRCAIAKFDTPRTFVKISFSTKKYNRAGNTINDLFDYNWEMVPRGSTRNHPWAEGIL